MAEQRRSLVDDGLESVGTPRSKAKAKSGLGGSGNGLKIALIVVCLGAAAVLLAYNFGLIDLSSPPKVAPKTAEDLQNIEEFNKQAETAKKSSRPPAVGGS